MAMIRECSVHGYFSDEPLCPACNDEGKFIMRTGERNSMARRKVAVLVFMRKGYFNLF